MGKNRSAVVVVVAGVAGRAWCCAWGRVGVGKVVMRFKRKLGKTASGCSQLADLSHGSYRYGLSLAY